MKRRILHVRDCDRKMLDEYCRIYVKTVVLPKRIPKEGQAEFYRHVILGRLQNRMLKDIAQQLTPSKKPKRNNKGYLIRCLRCRQESRVDLVAKCGHCGSYAVRLIKAKGEEP